MCAIIPAASPSGSKPRPTGRLRDRWRQMRRRHPIFRSRLLAIAESIAGLVLFGMLISKFVSRRQEELISEIHRIAFEDRLGRVRTNLHLVRTELQTTAQLCEGHEIAPPEAIGRVESIAIVFAGELHAVHDLLFRPQQALEEPVLEMI